MSLQLRVPEQLKIIGYDGTFLSEIVTPSITTVWQNTEKKSPVQQQISSSK